MTVREFKMIFLRATSQLFLVSACRLQVLYLGGNRLHFLPDTVGFMSSLQSLILCDNKLQVTTDLFLKNYFANKRMSIK